MRSGAGRSARPRLGYAIGPCADVATHSKPRRVKAATGRCRLWAVSGYLDLHCHCVAAIDDGVRSSEESRELLSALAKLGFDEVVATPHMRPGMFDNDRSSLRRAFAETAAALGSHRETDDSEWWVPDDAELPRLALSAEHYFDDVVYQRVLQGEALPYPGGRAVLLEFWETEFPASIDRLLARLRREGLVPVIAHPERYRAIWHSPETLERLLDVGAAALLDTAALVGKYGKKAKRCAEELLAAGYYQAACSDCHRPADVEEVERGIARIRRLRGPGAVTALFVDGPRQLLRGLTTA